MSYWNNREVAFSALVGKTITSITGMEADSDVVTITCEDGASFRMYHSQDCCESVAIESVVGDVRDLIGSPILVAEESTSEIDPADYKPQDDYRESFSWTFYKLATIKGYVDLRWLGESNGYYSESVDFVQVTAEGAPNVQG